MTDSPTDLSAASCPDAVVRPVLRKILMGFQHPNSQCPDARRPPGRLFEDATPVADLHAFLNGEEEKAVAIVGLGYRGEGVRFSDADVAVIRACLARAPQILAIADRECDFYNLTVRGDLLANSRGKLF